jgi:hypothetical protein
VKALGSSERRALVAVVDGIIDDTMNMLTARRHGGVPGVLGLRLRRHLRIGGRASNQTHEPGVVLMPPSTCRSAPVIWGPRRREQRGIGDVLRRRAEAP